MWTMEPAEAPYAKRGWFNTELLRPEPDSDEPAWVRAETVMMRFVSPTSTMLLTFKPLDNCPDIESHRADLADLATRPRGSRTCKD